MISIAKQPYVCIRCGADINVGEYIECGHNKGVFHANREVCYRKAGEVAQEEMRMREHEAHRHKTRATLERVAAYIITEGDMPEHTILNLSKSTAISMGEDCFDEQWFLVDDNHIWFFQKEMADNQPHKSVCWRIPKDEKMAAVIIKAALGQ